MNFKIGSLGYASGAVIDFTLRIGAPQLELGAFATSRILPPVGAPAAQARAADAMGVTDTGWLKSGAGTAVLTANTLAGAVANVSQAGDGTHLNSVTSLIAATPDGQFRRLRYWPRALSAAELQAATR